MMQGEKEERREEEQMYPSTHSGQKWVNRVLVPTWGVDEKTLDWVLLRPAPQNVAEKKEGAVGASAHRKPLAAELKHGRHAAPGRAGSGTLKQKRDWSVGDITREDPLRPTVVQGMGRVRGQSPFQNHLSECWVSGKTQGKLATSDRMWRQKSEPERDLLLGQFLSFVAVW